PLTKFGEEFLYFIKALCAASWMFLFYTIIRPAIYKAPNTEQSFQKAKYILQQFGDSPLDHFKISQDKQLYFSVNYDAFVSYRVANGFAVVLEEPVCSEENKTIILNEFEDLCKRTGLKPVYYRVDEDSLYHFKSFNRKKILIGQEGILQ